MIKIGITGGIGSGKSTVCDVWQALGAYVINADDLAKNIMTNNDPVIQAITKAFGEESYHPDGTLNRAHLATEAFEKGRVEELNAIVHPHVQREAALLMRNGEERGFEVAVYEAALLLQNLRPDNLDYVVLVLADESRRIGWVQERDKTNRQQVTERINKQQNFGELTHLADFVIKNDGTLAELKENAKQLYQRIAG